MRQSLGGIFRAIWSFDENDLWGTMVWFSARKEFRLYATILAAVLLPAASQPLAQTSGFQAISEGEGVSISVTGMLIVFFALTIISLFIRLLPVALDVMAPILPKLEPHAQPPTVAEQMPTDKEKIVAAIGYVLHSELTKAAKSSK